MPAADQTLVMALAHVTTYARACDGRPNSEVFDTLSDYYDTAERLAALAGGRVVKFIGDGVLFAFPEEAAKSAMSAIEEFRSTAIELWHDFHSSCSVEINVHVGSVAAGEFRHGDERHFDIVGKAVNELFTMPWDGFQLSAELQVLLDA